VDGGDDSGALRRLVAGEVAVADHEPKSLIRPAQGSCRVPAGLP
jgi:hypothetical protein